MARNGTSAEKNNEFIKITLRRVLLVTLRHVLYYASRR